MSASARPIIETRHEQMFPTLEPAEIDRLRGFGTTRSFGPGEHLARTGEVAPGMFVILSGEVAITQRDEFASVIRTRGGTIEGLLMALREKTGMRN